MPVGTIGMNFKLRSLQYMAVGKLWGHSHSWAQAGDDTPSSGAEGT